MRKTTEEQWQEIEIATHNIHSYMHVMLDYCIHNHEIIKIVPLIALVEQIQAETSKISNKF